MVLPPQPLVSCALPDDSLRNLQPANNSGLEEDLEEALRGPAAARASSLEKPAAGMEEPDPPRRPADFGKGPYGEIPIGGVVSHRVRKGDPIHRDVTYESPPPFRYEMHPADVRPGVEIGVRQIQSFAVPLRELSRFSLANLTFRIVPMGAEQIVPPQEEPGGGIAAPPRVAPMAKRYLLQLWLNEEWVDLDAVHLDDGSPVIIGREDLPRDLSPLTQTDLEATWPRKVSNARYRSVFGGWHVKEPADPEWRVAVSWVENELGKTLFLPRQALDNAISRGGARVEARPGWNVGNRKFVPRYLQAGHVQVEIMGEEVVFSDLGSTTATRIEASRQWLEAQGHRIHESGISLAPDLWEHTEQSFSMTVQGPSAGDPSVVEQAAADLAERLKDQLIVVEHVGDEGVAVNPEKLARFPFKRPFQVHFRIDGKPQVVTEFVERGGQLDARKPGGEWRAVGYDYFVEEWIPVAGQSWFEDGGSRVAEGYRVLYVPSTNTVMILNHSPYQIQILPLAGLEEGKGSFSHPLQRVWLREQLSAELKAGRNVVIYCLGSGPGYEPAAIAYALYQEGGPRSPGSDHVIHARDIRPEHYNAMLGHFRHGVPFALRGQLTGTAEGDRDFAATQREWQGWVQPELGHLLDYQESDYQRADAVFINHIGDFWLERLGPAQRKPGDLLRENLQGLRPGAMVYTTGRDADQIGLDQPGSGFIQDRGPVRSGVSSLVRYRRITPEEQPEQAAGAGAEEKQNKDEDEEKGEPGPDDTVVYDPKLDEPEPAKVAKEEESWSGSVTLPGGLELESGAWRQRSLRASQQDVYRVTPLMRDGKVRDGQVVGYTLTLADGISGVRAGGTSARWVCRRVPDMLARDEALLEALEKYPGLSDAERREVQREILEIQAAGIRAVHREMATANQRFFEKRRGQRPQRYGSTVVQVLIVGSDAFIAKVGDSWFQLIRGGRVAYRTTDDRSAQGELTQSMGKLSQHATIDMITEEETVGYMPAELVIEQQVIALQPGDLLASATDGILPHLTDENLAAAAADPSHSLEEVGREILGHAQQGRDNRGLTLARVGPAASSPIPPGAGMEERPEQEAAARLGNVSVHGHELVVEGWPSEAASAHWPGSYRSMSLELLSQEGSRKIIGHLLVLADDLSEEARAAGLSRRVAGEISEQVLNIDGLWEDLERYPSLSEEDKMTLRGRGVIQTALSLAIERTRETIANENVVLRRKDFGCDAVLALVVGDDVFLQNVGNTRAILVRAPQAGREVPEVDLLTPEEVPSSAGKLYIGKLVQQGKSVTLSEPREEIKIYGPDQLSVRGSQARLKLGDRLVLAGSDPARSPDQVAKDVLMGTQPADRSLIAVEYRGRPAAGMEEAEEITVEQFAARYGAQMPDEQRARIEQWVARGDVTLTDVTVPDMLTLYAQGVDLFLAVAGHIEPRSPPGVAFNARLLPIPPGDWQEIGLIYKLPEIPLAPGNNNPRKSLPVRDLTPEGAPNVEIHDLLSAIFRARLGMPESQEILVEFFQGAEGKRHAVIFA